MTDVIDLDTRRIAKRSSKQITDISGLSAILAEDISLYTGILSPNEVIATVCDSLGRLIQHVDFDLDTDLLQKALLFVETSALKERAHNVHKN